MQVAAKELLALLAKPSLDGIPLLVLGNKNDLPGALGTQQLIQQLELQVGEGSKRTEMQSGAATAHSCCWDSVGTGHVAAMGCLQCSLTPAGHLRQFVHGSEQRWGTHLPMPDIVISACAPLCCRSN